MHLSLFNELTEDLAKGISEVEFLRSLEAILEVHKVASSLENPIDPAGDKKLE